MSYFNTLNFLDIRPVAPELVIICIALILILLDLMVKKKEIVAFAGVVGTALALYLSFKIYALIGSQTTFGGMFIIDRYSNFFKLIFYVNVILTIGISVRYMALERSSFGEYYALLLLATSGMMIIASALDLIVLYLGLELMSLSIYILVGFLRNDMRSNEAALKYFLLGGFSSALLVYGISIIYGLTGTTDIKDIAAFINEYGLADNRILLLSMVLFAVAFGFKLAAVPFHMWAPDAYEGAPTSITAFMSVGAKAAGFAALGRVFLIAFSSIKVEWSTVLIPLAILSMCVGNIVAISQTNIKRMLAYSSIAHAGYALLGIIAGTGGGLSSMMNYMFIYTFMNIGAFAVVIMLRSEGFRGEDLSDYEGLAQSHPLTSALMLVFMFSLTGIPPTAGFVAKFYVFMEAINTGYVSLVIIAVIFSVVSAFFYLRVVMYMYMKEPKGKVRLTPSVPMSLSLAITTLMVLVLGIFPSYILEFAKRAIFS
jgi:NADH-quinone oxidoreductase subunit N